jgi:hypothetical protein
MVKRYLGDDLGFESVIQMVFELVRLELGTSKGSSWEGRPPALEGWSGPFQVYVGTLEFTLGTNVVLNTPGL